MSTCQELQEKIKHLKNLQSEFEQIYGALPAGSNRDQGKREVLAQVNEKRDEIELMIEQIEKLLYWKKIKLGTFRTVNELRQAILDQGDRISPWCKKMMEKTELSQSEIKVYLMTATTKELTGKDKATYQEIKDAIIDHGGELCPAEVGLQLRLQYQDQPIGESLMIVMESLFDHNGEPRIWAISSYIDPLLDSVDGQSNSRVVAGHRWVYCVNKHK